MPRIIVGIMGPGEAATAEDCANAERLGEAIAERGWVALTGGRPIGVMEAALRGGKYITESTGFKQKQDAIDLLRRAVTAGQGVL